MEALFTDEEILNRFWFNHDAATEKARLLLRFAFDQVHGPKHRSKFKALFDSDISKDAGEPVCSFIPKVDGSLQLDK